MAPLLPEGLLDTGLPRAVRRDPMRAMRTMGAMVRPAKALTSRPLHKASEEPDTFRPFLVVSVKDGVTLDETGRIWPDMAGVEHNGVPV